jgi:uncharacterized membrane protein YeaQ/YmgE (transglycosylase-associated protein family)
MKTLKYLAPAIIVYLCFAFILWEFNPGKWDEAIRFMYIIVAIIGAAIFWQINNENEIT